MLGSRLGTKVLLSISAERVGNNYREFLRTLINGRFSFGCMISPHAIEWCKTGFRRRSDGFVIVIVSNHAIVKHFNYTDTLILIGSLSRCSEHCISTIRKSVWNSLK